MKDNTAGILNVPVSSYTTHVTISSTIKAFNITKENEIKLNIDPVSSRDINDLVNYAKNKSNNINLEFFDRLYEFPSGQPFDITVKMFDVEGNLMKI